MPDMGLCGETEKLTLNRHFHHIAPLRPRTIVDLRLCESQKMRQHKPGVRGLRAYVGVENRCRFRLQHSVINLELLGRAEAGVGIVGTVPFEVDGAGDVAVAHGGAVGGIAIGIVLGGLARKLLWGAGIHERSFGLAHLVYEGTQDGIIAAYLGVFGYGEVRHHEGSIAFLGHPGIAATIEQANILVAKEGKYPQGVGCLLYTSDAADDAPRV